MEVFTGEGRRRRWSAAKKGAIIAEGYGTGETVSCPATPRSDATAAVHLATTGQAERCLTADHARPASLSRAINSPRWKGTGHRQETKDRLRWRASPLWRHLNDRHGP
jgi:hypothetical protein